MGQSGSQSTTLLSAEAVAQAKKEVQEMSVKELKIYLGKAGVDTSSCVEKGDLVKRALVLAEKHATAARRPPRAQKGVDVCFCWKWLLPERAPEWYVKKLGGRGSGTDVHDRPAPPGALFALGHVELKVPDLSTARGYYETGLGFVKSSRGAADEVRLNAGPSQLWLKNAPNEEADRWPGEIRVWVDNIQTTYDHMSITDHVLNSKLVTDYGEGVNGGEFSMKILDPFLRTFYVFTEAPENRREKIQKIGCEACSMHSNVLALSDLSIKCKSRADMQLFGLFYKEFFGAAITTLQYSCMVHFSPGQDLHQTLTFKEDTVLPPATNLASLCFYLRDKAALQAAYSKCSAAGLVERPASWAAAEAALEFVIKGMVDPSTGRMLLPMRNIIRCAGHLDCLVIT